MRGKPWIKIGDVFEIPLPNKKKVYGQYVFFDKESGAIVQIFDGIVDYNQTPNIDQIANSKLLFPPVYAAIIGIIKLGRWKVIGHSKTINFKFKGFLQVRWDMDTKIATKWLFYNGKKTKDLGPDLPEKYKGLEWRAALPYDYIEGRVQTGFSPFNFMKEHKKWPKKEEIPWEIVD